MEKIFYNNEELFVKLIMQEQHRPTCLAAIRYGYPLKLSFIKALLKEDINLVKQIFSAPFRIGREYDGYNDYVHDHTRSIKSACQHYFGIKAFNEMVLNTPTMWEPFLWTYKGKLLNEMQAKLKELIVARQTTEAIAFYRAGEKVLSRWFEGETLDHRLVQLETAKASEEKIHALLSLVFLAGLKKMNEKSVEEAVHKNDEAFDILLRYQTTTEILKASKDPWIQEELRSRGVIYP